MAYYGEDFHESELIRILKTDENEGTNLKEIVDFLNSQGLKTSLKQHMTINELRSYIDRNIPVIVLIQAWGEENDFARNYKDCWDDGHFVVVIGYTVKDIILSDPALFTRGYIPISEFTDRWHDYDEGNTRTYQLGLAVYGKTPKFEQNTLERIR
jgi:ABC-type bacteriocin/lantibiotic exporter with double-glycine peptidase domain